MKNNFCALLKTKLWHCANKNKQTKTNLLTLHTVYARVFQLGSAEPRVAARGLRRKTPNLPGTKFAATISM